ncbi:MAG: dockerin type I repeat-containing protein [Candidatus Zixiibacteriota bacterium]
MRKIWKYFAICILVVFGTVSAYGSNITAIVTDTTSQGVIAVGMPFTIKIAMYNNVGVVYAFGMPFTFFSPDNSIENVKYVNVQGLSFTDMSTKHESLSDSSISIYNDWLDNWNTAYGFLAFDTIGKLPDTVNHSAAVLPTNGTGWVPGSPMAVQIGFNFIINEEGTFCIDSCSIPHNEWFFDGIGTPFNGPYCWDVVNYVMCGDVTNDGIVNILDIVALINYIYKDGENAVYPYAGDVDGNGKLNIIDITIQIKYCYQGGELSCQ